MREVLAGRADIFTASRSSSRFQSVAARYPLQAHSIPLQATEFAFLNVSRPPFDDVRVRRALDCAIDRRQVARCSPAARVGCDVQLNWVHFCDSRIDAQVARLEKEEPAGPGGTAGEAAIDRELTNEAPFVRPLVNPRFVDLTSARVGNYQVNIEPSVLDRLWVR